MSGEISVVVTCYNLGHTIEEALDSVYRQTRPAAEIIVVDDGSTEPLTRQVLALLRRRGTRVVSTENRGVSAARNLGASLSFGQYLVFLDADDVFDPTYFDKAAARLDGDATLDFVTCPLQAFEGATYLWTPSPLTWLDAVSTGGVPHISTMTRRRLWDAVGGYDASFGSFEDLDFWTTVLELGSKGAILPEPLLRYRVRAGSNYHRAIQPETHMGRMGQFYAKHRAEVGRHGLDLLAGREAFIVGQREYQRLLQAQKEAVDGELASLDAEIESLEARRRSNVGGIGAGTPVDQHYIDMFLAEHRCNIRGYVVEAGDGDLSWLDAIEPDVVDAVVLTRPVEPSEVPSLLVGALRVLRPGGVLLCVVSAAVPEVCDEGAPRLTESAVYATLAGILPLECIEVLAYGGPVALAALRCGIPVEELSAAEQDGRDPQAPLFLGVRATKPLTALGGCEVGGAGSIALDRGIHTMVASRSSNPEGAVILTYHRIAALVPDVHGLCVDPQTFRRQMEHLCRSCELMTLDELTTAAGAGRMPPRTVAVTFDDGYLDALTTASPILAALGVPATFFVTSGALDDGREFLWDAIDRIFRSSLAVPSTLAIELDGRPFTDVTATTGDRERVARRLDELLYPLSTDRRTSVLDQLVRWSGVDPTPRSTHRRMTAEEVRELGSRARHTIGGHTVHHLNLMCQTFETERWEILEDRRRLAEVLRRPVRSFSYPYGEFTARTVEVVRAAGIATAVTCRAAPVGPATDPLLLPRVEVKDCSDFEAWLERQFNAEGARTRAAAAP